MTTSQRQNNFNLLRLILATLVLVSHSSELIDGNRGREPLTRMFGTYSLGDLAVSGFFLLSGYLIMQSWDAQPYGWPFLKKRILRIYPGFIVASLICAFVVGPLGAIPVDYFDSFDPSAFFSGLLFLQKPVVPAVFAGQPYPVLNGALWTICREFACYLLVFATGVTGALRIRHFWLGLTIAALIIVLLPKPSHLPFIDGRDIRVSSFFLVGGCFYIYRQHINFRGKVALLFTAMTCSCMFFWRPADLAMPILGGYALLYAASKRSRVLSGFNRLPDVSYGAYLYGWPIQKLIIWYYPLVSPWLLTGISIVLTLVAGTVSWHLIEKPALRLKGPSLPVMEADAERVVT